MHFQFETLRVSNHTACRFAEKTRFFRSLWAGRRCAAAPRYAPLQYDNGDDYVREGLYRIVNEQGKVGYADAQGRVIIAPRFAFGFPFEQGKARVTDSGREVSVPGSGGEHRRWESDAWYYIDRTGKRLDDAASAAAESAK